MKIIISLGLFLSLNVYAKLICKNDFESGYIVHNEVKNSDIGERPFQYLWECRDAISGIGFIRNEKLICARKSKNGYFSVFSYQDEIAGARDLTEGNAGYFHL